MSKTKVINLTRFQQYVDVRHADGAIDAIRISPQGRVDLRDGMTVDKRWLQMNPSAVAVHLGTTVGTVEPAKEVATVLVAVEPEPVAEPEPEPAPEVEPDSADEAQPATFEIGVAPDTQEGE